MKQESISTIDKGVRECAKLLKQMMQECGIQSRLIETKGHPVVYGEWLKAENAFTCHVLQRLGEFSREKMRDS